MKTEKMMTQWHNLQNCDVNGRLENVFTKFGVSSCIYSHLCDSPEIIYIIALKETRKFDKKNLLPIITMTIKYHSQNHDWNLVRPSLSRYNDVNSDEIADFVTIKFYSWLYRLTKSSGCRSVGMFYVFTSRSLQWREFWMKPMCSVKTKFPSQSSSLHFCKMSHSVIDFLNIISDEISVFLSVLTTETFLAMIFLQVQRCCVAWFFSWCCAVLRVRQVTMCEH